MGKINSYGIVIVNWNSGKQLSDCLKSIDNANLNKLHLNKVIVIDNASKDMSEQTDVKYNYSYELIKNSRNMGFAYACNQGAAKIDADYIIFLNPDTRLFENTLIKLNQFMIRKKENIKIVGIQLVDELGNVSKTCSRFPNNLRTLCKSLGITKIFPRTGCIMNEWNHKSSRIVDQVMGAFFVIENKTFKALNGFDERFFVYYEEVDLCKRVSNLGYKSFYYTGSKAYHKGGGTSVRVVDKRLFYILSNYLKYEMKHSGIFAAYLALIIEIIEYLTRLIYLVGKGQCGGIKKLNKSYILLLRNLSTIFVY